VLVNITREVHHRGHGIVVADHQRRVHSKRDGVVGHDGSTKYSCTTGITMLPTADVQVIDRRAATDGTRRGARDKRSTFTVTH
jgi:hypothetical protein